VALLHSQPVEKGASPRIGQAIDDAVLLLFVAASLKRLAGLDRADSAPLAVLCAYRAVRLWLGSGRDGNLWNDGDYKNWRKREFRHAVLAAGLPASVRPYDLRHAFSSLLIAEGRSVVEIAAQMCHAPTMTLDTYGHVNRGARRRREGFGGGRHQSRASGNRRGQ
jgi:integrase